jgi:hypothetical protein
MERRCNEQEACDTIVWACIKLSNKEKKKNKYTMGLNIHIPMNFHTTTNQK